MESISLIIPISETDVPTDTDIASYRRVLRDQAHASSVEVILAGHFPAAAHAPGASDSILIPTAGTGKIACAPRGDGRGVERVACCVGSAPSLYAAGDRRGDRRPLDFGRRFGDRGSAPGSAPFLVAYAGAALPGSDEPVNLGNFGLVLGVDRYSTRAIAGGHESPPRSRLAACP